MDTVIKQKVEVLNGDRGNAEEAAARIKHLRAMVTSLPSAPNSMKLSSETHTKAEVDLLIKDVQALYAAFNALRALLR